MLTPLESLPREEVPDEVVPIQLPTTRFPLALPKMAMPVSLLPEIRFRSEALVPPMVLFVAVGLMTATSSKVFGTLTVPVASVPM